MVEVYQEMDIRVRAYDSSFRPTIKTTEFVIAECESLCDQAYLAAREQALKGNR